MYSGGEGENAFFLLNNNLCSALKLLFSNMTFLVCREVTKKKKKTTRGVGVNLTGKPKYTGEGVAVKKNPQNWEFCPKPVLGCGG